jgi:hypothetical protein
MRETGCSRGGRDRLIPFSCPVCGRKTDYPPEELREGSVLVCSFCKLTLRLHGHMWQEVQREIEKLAKG